jgi:hypothetical protein
MPVSTRPDPFLETILMHLTKIFLPSTNRDPVAAREAAIRMLDAFNCETQPEQLLAANAIAFSIQALETFNQATAPGVTASQAKRLQACASSLCREATNAKNELAQIQHERRTTPATPDPEPIAKPARVTWTAAFQDTQRARRIAAFRKTAAL